MIILFEASDSSIVQPGTIKVLVLVSKYFPKISDVIGRLPITKAFEELADSYKSNNAKVLFDHAK